MRRLGVLLGTVVVAAALGSTSASGAGAPIVNLAPPGEAVLAPATSVEVQFSCPSFNTTYGGEKNWLSYWVHFSTSPLRGFESGFVSDEIATEHAYLVAGTTETCHAFLAEPWTETADTYYWLVERINCDVASCAEFGVLGSFAIVPPAPPGGSGKQPAEAGVGAAKLNAYTGCGLSEKTISSNVCSGRQKMGAFFESSKALSFKVCVRFPGGKTACAGDHQAEGEELYVNRIASSLPGRYTVSWVAEGRRIVRHIRRLPR